MTRDWIGNKRTLTLKSQQWGVKGQRRRRSSKFTGIRAKHDQVSDVRESAPAPPMEVTLSVSHMTVFDPHDLDLSHITWTWGKWLGLEPHYLDLRYVTWILVTWLGLETHFIFVSISFIKHIDDGSSPSMVKANSYTSPEFEIFRLDLDFKSSNSGLDFDFNINDLGLDSDLPCFCVCLHLCVKSARHPIKSRTRMDDLTIQPIKLQKNIPSFHQS